MARGDIPEYKRKQGIETPGGEIGAVQAAETINQARSNAQASKQNLAESQGNLTKAGAQKLGAEQELELAKHGATAHKLNISSLIGSVGLQLANSASLERAKLAGIEAAKTRGQTFLPAINQTDAEFRKSYQQEEFNSAKYEASSFLTKIASTALNDPNPNAKTLETYQVAAAKQLKLYVDQINPANRKDFERDIMSTYQNSYYQIAKRVEDNNRRYLQGAHAAQDAQLAQEVQDNNLDDRTESAQQKFEERLNHIDNVAKSDGWSEDMILKKKNEAIAEFQTSKFQGEYKKVVESEGEEAGAKYVAELRKNKPEGVTPSQHEAVVASVGQYANQYQAAVQNQQQFAYAQAKVEATQGTLTPQKLEQYKAEMGDTFALKLDLDIAKLNLKKEKLLTDTTFINSNLGSPAILANIPDKGINAWYGEQVKNVEAQTGQPATMQQRAMIAENIQREIPDFKEQITSLAKSGNIQNIGQAAKAYDYLAQNNPLALNGVDAKVSKALKDYSSGAKGGMAEKDLLPVIQEALKPVPAAEYSQRVESYKDIRKELGWNKPEKQLSDIADLTGFEKGAVSDGMLYAYNSDFESYYLQTGDVDLAKQQAAMAIQSTYSEEDINGFKQVMFAGPSKFYNIGGQGISYLKLQMYSDAKSLAEKSKEAFKGGHTSWYYEIESRPIEEHVIKSAKEHGGAVEKFEPSRIIASGEKRIAIKKVFADGKVSNGFLAINSDNATGMPAEGNMPDYGFYMVNSNGKYESINIPGSVAQARFKPDTKPLTEHYKKKNEDHVRRMREVDKFRADLDLRRLTSTPRDF
jgi:hypothetical protein